MNYNQTNNIEFPETNIYMSSFSDLAPNKNREADEIVENINKIFLFLRIKKRCKEKILVEEGMKLITKTLDISKLFNNSFIIKKNKENLATNSFISISEENRAYLNLIKRRKNRKIKLFK